MNPVPKIYLAGPDVFSKDASGIFLRMEQECAARGMQGLRPSDGGLSLGVTGTRHQIAQLIYEANMVHIRNCDAVVANFMPFRGEIEPDSGTVFEVGVATALGKPVAGYLAGTGFFADKVMEKFGAHPRDDQGLIFDQKFGFMVEEFDLPLNLMLACSASIHASFTAALDRLKIDLLAKSNSLQAKACVSTRSTNHRSVHP